MKTEEQYFDQPIPQELIDRSAERMNLDSWGLDRDRWKQDQSIDFYKGMYSLARVALSICKEEEAKDYLLRIGIDCLAIIHSKSNP